MAKFREKADQEADRYKHDKEEIQTEARKLEQEVATERNRADLFDLAEVFLEIGLVVTSITPAFRTASLLAHGHCAERGGRGRGVMGVMAH